MKKSSTPMRFTLKLYKEDRPEKSALTKEIIKMQKRYRTLVGTIIFISTTCRPDITYATMILCRPMSNPGGKHMDAALYLLGYLKRTLYKGIEYKCDGNLVPFIYSDADDGSDESRKTTVGHSSIIQELRMTGRPN
jgi:hypothetical protein